MLLDNSPFSLSPSVSPSLVFHIVLFYGDNQNCCQSSTNFPEIVIFNVFSPNKVISKEFYKLLAIMNFLNLMGQFFLDHRKRKRLRQISLRESNYCPGLEILGILHALVDDDFVEVQVPSMTDDDGIIVGLALPPFYFYSRGVKEFLGTIRQHVFLVRSAEDANAFLVNDFQNPLLRTLSSLELPRAVSAAIEPSMSMPIRESPSNDSQERTDVGIRSGSFSMLQYNMKQRHKAQDPARDFVYLLHLGIYFSCLLACKVFDKIPYRDFVAWSILRTLRWACRISGHDRVGKEIVGYLIEFKAHEAGYYALWLNIYSLVGNWEKVWNVQKFLQQKK